MQSCTISEWPPQAAAYTGANSSSSASSTSAPDARHSIAHSLCPWWHDISSGLTPMWLHRLTSAPASISSLAASASPRQQQTIRGVSPGTFCQSITVAISSLAAVFSRVRSRFLRLPAAAGRVFISIEHCCLIPPWSATRHAVKSFTPLPTGLEPLVESSDGTPVHDGMASRKAAGTRFLAELWLVCSPCTAPCTAALLAPLMAEPAACNPWPTASRHGVVVALTASPASLKACDMAPVTSCCQLLVMLRNWASLKPAGAERSQSLPAACSCCVQLNSLTALATPWKSSTPRLMLKPGVSPALSSCPVRALPRAFLKVGALFQL
mmetsp:Transcript_36743/g.88200  ORF Transcript_36743/g.88200 Transcript_36743/m.88200 type:complete len:324 (-) Transcript_36743:1338-2309(-)